MRSRLASFAVLAALTACQRCGSTRTGSGIDVAPLPSAPDLAVEQEDVPGARGELAVVVARPQGRAQGNLRPTITFSKPIVALGSVEHEKGLSTPIAIEPALEGEWRWLGSATVEFAPKGLVPYSTSFTVTVPRGLRALDGSELAEPHVFSFETPRPEVQAIEPSDRWKWVRPDQPLVLVFNQPVLELAGHLRLTAEGEDVGPLEVKEIRLADQKRAVEEGRRHERLGFEEKGVMDRRARYEVSARRPLPLDAELELRIEGELRGVDGPLALEGAPRWTFRTYGPFRVKGATRCWSWSSSCPWGPLVLETTNPADPASLKASLKISPPAEIDWDRVEIGQERVELYGELVPGTRYEIVVGKEAKDAFGQALGEPVSRSVKLGDLEPELDAGHGIALLEAKGDGVIPAKTVNVGDLELALRRVEVPELARLLAAGKPASMEGATERTLDVSSAKNRYRRSPLPVRELLGRPTGLFVLRIEASDLPRHSRRRQVLGQVTDLAVHAKLGATSGLAWVTRLSDGRPVVGARVALHDKDGQERWTGSSDADGLARLPGLAQIFPGARSWWDLPPAIVSARLNDDVGVTLSTWSSGLAPWAFGVEGAWEGSEPHSLGGVFAERGIYRPGDEVHLKGIVRYRKLGRIVTPPAGVNVRVTVTSSRGKEIFSRSVPLTSFGTWSTALTVPTDAPLGMFEARAETKVEGDRPIRNDGQFRVEEYRAPQFQVDVVAAPREVVAGDALKADVVARYLFGGGMPSARVRWAVARSSVDFEPPGNTGFTFGPRSWWWDDDEPSPTSDVFASGEGETGPLGTLTLAPGTAETPGGRTFAYAVEAEVEDVNRQRIANRSAVTVHPASVYAGVRRRSTGFAEAGKADALEIVAAAPDGTRKTGLAVEVAFVRREWRWIRKRGAGGEWFWENEVDEKAAGSCKVKTEASPVACPFTPKDPGLYVAAATVKDEKGRTQTTRFPFYAVGAGWVSWQRDATDKVDLVPDRQVYAPGDVAKVLVKSPFPEAEAILTIEREGVTLARRVRLAGAATALEVPLGEDDVPNVFVSVVLVRGRVPGAEPSEADADPGRPQVRVGYTRLAVEKASKRLTVAVVPDGTEKRPREKVRVDLEVKDRGGKGVPAEVTVYAVDEGVLRLTAYQVPDPVEMIHPPRGLSVRIGEPLLHLVERRRYGEKGDTSGGGGGDGSGGGFRSRFKTTVLFAPEVQADARGKARVEIELPDNLTTYRIMAVAVAKDDRTGSGESKVSVAKPLMALPALPRLARSGDRFEAGVVVHAPGGEIREVEVRAEATGLALDGAPVKKVSLHDGKPREVRFPFRASAPGEAVLRFFASGGGEKDGVEQRIPVRLPVELEAVAVYGDTRGVRREGLVPPGGVRPDVGGLEVTLASTALGGFAENARQLVEYPYGCLEQLSSRLVPFVALRELQGRFGIPHEPGEKPAAPPTFLRDFVGEAALRIHQTSDPDEIVRRTVKAIETLQNADGGYRYWPSSTCTAEWASSYAVLALGRAAELGYPVDREALARGQAYLSGTVAAGRCTRCWFTCEKPGDEVRSFALYALARTGAPKASYYGEIFGRREKLPLFAKAMLADAMFVGGGDRGDARKLLQEILNHAKESAAEVHFEETDPRTYAALWSSDPRTTAIVLQTLASISPDHPYVSKIAAYLGKVRRGDGRFRNTQEAAFALMAFSEVIRTKEKEAPHFTARVTLGGEKVAETRFSGRTTEVRRSSVAMKALPRADQQLPLDFAREGEAGVLYYGALLRYAPSEVPKDPLDRGLFVQRWFEPYEGGGQVRAARAGELVRVRVRVASPAERQYVAVAVPVPAGLEIVDTTLASTAMQRAEPEEEGPGEEYEYESEEDVSEEDELPPWATRFWSPFHHEERRDDRLVLFADRLPPGVHVASFVARATTPGEWVLTPAHAEEMYTPEVFGRSDGGSFRVLADEKVAAR